jgi:hypothetical protein
LATTLNPFSTYLMGAGIKVSFFSAETAKKPLHGIGPKPNSLGFSLGWAFLAGDRAPAVASGQ